MSALWLLLVLAVWGGVTWLLWEGIRKFIGVKPIPRQMRIGIAAITAIFWLGVSFWYGGGQKIYFDAEVKRLCAVDGGIKVIEKVRLPAEKFDQYGNVEIPTKKDAKPSDNYYYETNTTYYRTGNPEVRRSHNQIIRRSDGKVLGEFVYYARRGGDMPGPWHESAFGCPDLLTLPNFENSIFSKE